MYVKYIPQSTEYVKHISCKVASPGDPWRNCPKFWSAHETQWLALPLLSAICFFISSEGFEPKRAGGDAENALETDGEKHRSSILEIWSIIVYLFWGYSKSFVIFKLCIYIYVYM